MDRARLHYLRSLNSELPVAIGRNSTILPDRSDRHEGRAVMQLLAISRAEPGKALDVLIDALHRLPALPCQLTLVGDGPDLASLRKRARGDRRIRFLGALAPQEARQTVADADIFLFPSRYDIFGLVIVEAMGAGLATVVSSLPGAVDDLCVSEHNCLVVDGEASDWAAAISRLVHDPDLRRRIGDAAAVTIRERWTIDHAADAMIAGLSLGASAIQRRVA